MRVVYHEDVTILVLEVDRRAVTRARINFPVMMENKRENGKDEAE
ncbi:MAG: hypothetical protein M5U34_41225 [Chloroflexi bacterium]|nr:hypothetical protein [Chloroflexota bacterium]